MISENSENSEAKYYCKKCDYKCSKKQHFKQHLTTSKHKKDIQNDKMISENSEDHYTCECGKKYNHQSNLSRHIKKCTKMQKLGDHHISFITDQIEENNQEDNPINSTIILELLKQNNEFKELIMEQNKKILELVNTGNSNVTNNNITNNNTTNNKFNLNVFLNEKCKDALNLTDFISNLNVGFADFENFGKIGYSNSISHIFIRGLKELDIYKRPIHCSDLKREVIHIKDDNTWKKDEEKEQMIKAIKMIEHKNIKQIPDWIKAHPAHADIRSKKFDEYSKMLDQSMGEYEDEDNQKNYQKIIRNVAKEILVEKDS